MMKKFWLISMLLIAALFVVSCGGDDDDSASNECSGSQFKCDQDGGKTFVYTCDEGTWQKTKQCNENETCNANTGKCDPANNGGDNGDSGNNETPGGNEDSGDSGSSDTGDSGDTGNGGNGNAMEACASIYQCFNQCETNECAQACFDNGDPAGQQPFMDMYNCWSDNCANASDFTSCAKENCLEVTEACGLSFGKDGDTNYGSPYGTAQINLSSSYVLGANENPAQNTVTMGSFISGNIGNSQIGNAAAAQSYYYTSLVTQSGSTYLQTLQLFTDAQGNPLSPIVVVITDVNAAVGNAEYSLVSQTSVGQIFIGDATVDAQGYLNIPCYDAFAEGTLTIQGIQATQGGNFALSGTIDLYSPANYMGYGDIQQDLGASACSPK